MVAVAMRGEEVVSIDTEIDYNTGCSYIYSAGRVSGRCGESD